MCLIVTIKSFLFQFSNPFTVYLFSAIFAFAHARVLQPEAATCGTPKIPPKVDDCGESKIVGGCEAVPYSWPWQIGFMGTFRNK